MKRIVLNIMTIVIIILLSTQIVYAEDENIYKSATEYDYPPFSVTSSGEADGFSVELLKEVMNVMDLHITFKIDNWSTLKDELKNGEIDILPLVGYTEERDEVYDFTVPYIIMHGNIFIRKDDDSITSEEDLYNKEIIVMEGDNAQEYAISIGLSDNLIMTATYEEAFKLLESGRYDAVLAQSLVGQQLINDLNLKNIKAATTQNEEVLIEHKINLTGFEQKFCFAVTEGNSELLAKLNEGLAIVSANGTFNELYVKWFPFLLENEYTFFDSVKSSLIITVPLIILILLVSVIFTRRQVRIKTKQLQKSHESVLIMEAHLRNQQKLESIGVLASGVAHEINNPLNGILNYSQIISDIIKNKDENCEKSRKDIDSFSTEIINETQRIAIIVKNLLQFSRQENLDFTENSMGDIIDRTLSLVNTIIKHDQIDLTIDIAKNLPMIECRSQQLQQVILNLLTNGKDALNKKYPGYNENKKIVLKAKTIKVNDKEGIRITIEDKGNGIPNSIKDNIFDPFFTTKSRTEGTGLGLSISYGIIEEHNGKLSFESEEGIFTRFCIELPLKQINI